MRDTLVRTPQSGVDPASRRFNIFFAKVNPLQTFVLGGIIIDAEGVFAHNINVKGALV